MRPLKIAIAVAKPRHRLVQALMGGLLRAGTRAGVRVRVHAPRPRRPRDPGQLDPDQRVRETGEWQAPSRPRRVVAVAW